MSRHDQRGSLAGTFVCTNCKNKECGACIDVARAVISDVTICNCKRSGHSGDPAEKQIADPFTGDIHAPGLVVTKEGEVRVDPEFKRAFIEQFE